MDAGKISADCNRARVTQQMAEEYAASLNHGRFTPSTYNKHLNLLTLVFRVLKNKARLVGNPWEEIHASA